MPIIKSAIKKMKQDKVRAERNKATKSRMKSYMKNVIETVKKDTKAAETLLPKTYSAIDTALKKNIIKKNNAARKKSRLAKLIDIAKNKGKLEKEVPKKTEKETKKK